MLRTIDGRGGKMVWKCSQCSKILFDFEKEHQCRPRCGDCGCLRAFGVGISGERPYCTMYNVVLPGDSLETAVRCFKCYKEKEDENGHI